MPITPYLFFDGHAEEAATFYRQAIDAEVAMMLRFSDSPDPMPEGMIPPGAEGKVMHMELRIGDARLFCSDGNCGGAPAFQGSAVALEAGDETEARRWFDGLSQGGQVQMPMGPTFFSPCFGMVADRFGVAWMVIVPMAQ